MTFHRIRLGLCSSALLILATCLGPLSLNAQTSTQGGVTGTVTDPSGAVVPGAAITIQNKATNAIAQAKTDGSGFFNVPLLDPGDYKVSITAPGFANYTADNVVVIVGQVTSLRPHLALASSSAEVVVTEQDSRCQH